MSQMTAIQILFCFYVAILTSFIHCNSSSEYDSDGIKMDKSLPSEKIRRILNKIAENGGTINDIFKPSKSGFLSSNYFSVTYKGKLLYPIQNGKVAMKFTDLQHKSQAEKEYEIYTYLNAIDNPIVELYGVPSVYYYGAWNNYIIMAITLLDREFSKRKSTLNEVDLLIVCKEFVRISKYIHSRGIHHRDIEFGNMKFRRNNGFIADYYSAQKMYNTTKLKSSSRKAGIQFAKNDWKIFLQSISSYCDADVDLNCNNYERETNSQIHDAMQALSTTPIEELKTVFLEMGNHIYGINDQSKKNDKTSSYDQIYGIIEEEIASCGEEMPTLLHWLSGEEEDFARREFVTNPIPSISSIEDPFKLVKIKYPVVDFEYFHKKILRLQWDEGSSSTHASCSPDYDADGKRVDTTLPSEKIKRVLNKIAENRGTINDVFKPSKKGYLSSDYHSVTYKGKLLYPLEEREVAMRFTDLQRKNYARKEYKIYTYLNAIDNPIVELYGVPSIYYYGAWNNYIIMAITLLDREFNQMYEVNGLNEVDLLIVCKEFVRISKYIHSRGIHHGDIGFSKMKFRRNNGFITDYTMAFKMYNATKLTSSSRTAGIKYAKNDWKIFLQTIASYCSVDVDLNCYSKELDTDVQMNDAMRKLNTTRIAELKLVFLEMGNYIFGLNDQSKKSDKTSSYDRIYEIIQEQIESYEEGIPTLLHWLSGEAEATAKKEFVANPTASISSIKDPFKLVKVKYPSADFEYFHKKILRLQSDESSIYSSDSEYDSKGMKIDKKLQSEQLKKRLNRMAKSYQTINDIFKPTEEGFLGAGAFGVTYKGIMLYPDNDIDVAMKFTHFDEKKEADKEYEVYTYLNAIDNPIVELYGIPSVYYYGTWDNYVMMAITLLDSEFEDFQKANDLNEIDLLILCKEFVRISKYIHRRGIHHGDIKFGNFMFRRNYGFIIDYNMAEKMYNTTKLDASSRTIGIECAKNDWKRFLESICSYCGVNIDFNCYCKTPETDVQINAVIQTLISAQEKMKELGKVFVEMATYIYGTNDTSNMNDGTSSYDRIYRIIDEVINDSCGDDDLLHWFCGREKAEVKQELISNPIPSISSIRDPFQLVQIKYPSVDFDYFRKKILRLQSDEGFSSKMLRKAFSTLASSKYFSKGKGKIK